MGAEWRCLRDTYAPWELLGSQGGAGGALVRAPPRAVAVDIEGGGRQGPSMFRPASVCSRTTAMPAALSSSERSTWCGRGGWAGARAEVRAVVWAGWACALTTAATFVVPRL